MNTRYRIIFFIISFFCLAALSRLVQMQIVSGDIYRAQSEQRIVKTSTVKAPRGEILDKKGRTLVQNKTGFSVEIHYISGQTNGERNDLIIRLSEIIQNRDENKVIDSLPISYAPYSFIFEGEGKEAQWKTVQDLKPEISAGEVIDYYREKYEVSDNYSQDEARLIAGVRYEMEQSAFSPSNPFTLAEDVGELAVTEIKEQGMDFAGIAINTTPVREFAEGNTAVHILGRVGKIYKEEYEALKSKNYSISDNIGKQGIEQHMEDVLKGTDGVNGIEQSIDGAQVRIVKRQAPRPGDNVVLTLDLDLQKAAEQALVDTISYVREQSVHEPDGSGADASCGAIAAIDINTGEILALASYPSYNPSRFNEDYQNLIKDKNSPMFNRAIGGTYAPGSIFKMVTALAALEEGVITTQDRIYDKGIYDFYKDYKPACWLYRRNGTSHGNINVTEALKHSCNYFFFETGRLTGIESLNKYARMLGLGERTGIELSGEESTGRLAGPADREKYNGQWMPGDTLQSAIGQSDNLFTPLQMASYMATLVNGGTRYQAHLVKAVRKSGTGELISEAEPEVLSKIDMDGEIYKAIMNGMKDVIEDGTASTVFEGFNIPVGGKTGTVEVPSGSPNATFLGFAPYDDPVIAVCAVIEHGAHGANAGVAVRAVLDAYFNAEVEDDTVAVKNSLMR